MDISVIMPAYNAADYIQDALDSILAQTFKGEVEILVADDVSTDGTKEILTHYAEQYPERIHLFFNKTNLGCSANSDTLTRRAKGKYLAFCDADDLWIDNKKLQKQFDILEHNPEIGMCCMPDPAQRDNTHQINSTSDSGFSLEFADLMTKEGDIINSSVMCRHSLFEKMREECAWFVDNKCFFDSVWAYWFSLRSKIWCMNEPVTLYRDRAESDCRTVDEKKKYELERRYFLIKTRFLLSSGMDTDFMMKVLSSNYDKTFSTGQWRGEMLVRNGRSYKLGKNLLAPLKLLQKI